jgi:hypothetical protein
MSDIHVITFFGTFFASYSTKGGAALILRFSCRIKENDGNIFPSVADRLKETSKLRSQKMIPSETARAPSPRRASIGVFLFVATGLSLGVFLALLSTSG